MSLKEQINFTKKTDNNFTIRNNQTLSKQTFVDLTYFIKSTIV